MAKLIKCKICGDTEFNEIGELLQCRSCKHKTPKPKENAELLERANNLRFETKSFDEAAALYEEIIRITPNEAEAYWGRVLCRYGIEYVKDSDGKYLPTCHRTIEGSILEDADYKMAISKAADGMSAYYTEEATIIDEYQKKIKLIASKEDPYDVFISFKATDDCGKPTEDSLLAQELYYYLTKNLGLKVFFSNITLKDKAGQEWEPIIYAALSSATVMVLVGTKSEFINATWVKNEWSRYIKMISSAKAQNKSKYIVTAIKNMKPEQLPSALASYQSVNLADLGAKEKLCSNIDSLIGDLRVRSEKTTNSGKFNADDVLSAEASNLCDLGYQQLALDDFDKADEYFQKALEKRSNTTLALWGRLLASEQANDDDILSTKTIPIENYSLYKLAMKSASEEERSRFKKVAKCCQENFDHADSKMRHNNEYKTKIEELKYNYAQNFAGERTEFDKKADDAFNRYETYQEGIKRNFGLLDEMPKKRKPILGIIVIILSAAFLLIASFKSLGIVDTVNKEFEPYLGVEIFDVIQKSGVSLNELLSDDFDLSKLELTQKQLSVLQDSELRTKILGSEGQAVLTDAVWVLASVFVLCVFLMIVLLKKLISLKWAIIITVFLAPFVSAMVCYGLLILTLAGKGNMPIMLGFVMLAAGVLWIALRILKYVKDKALRNSIEKQAFSMRDKLANTLEELKELSIQQITAINQEYFDKYGEEIERYEDSNCIVNEIFSSNE